MSAVFSRVRGSSGFSLLLASLRFGRGGWGGRVVGGFLGFGVGCARFLLPVGAGVGCAWRARLLCFARGLGACARPVLASLVLGRRGAGACAPGSCLPVFWGVGVGCVCASGSFLGCGFRGWVGRPGSFLGVGCAWFPVSCSRWFLSCSRRGFRVFLFPLGASFLWFGGVSGWVGVVFSPAVVLGPGSGWFLVGGWPGFGFGFVWRV